MVRSAVPGLFLARRSSIYEVKYSPVWEQACSGRRSDEGVVSGNIDIG